MKIGRKKGGSNASKFSRREKKMSRKSKRVKSRREGTATYKAKPHRTQKNEVSGLGGRIDMTGERDKMGEITCVSKGAPKRE